MAHSRSALKRWRQNERRRARNKPVRTATRTAVKRARVAVAADPASADAAIRQAASVVDNAAKRRIIHPNAAARHKSRLMRMQNRAKGATAAPEAPKRGRKTAAKKAGARKSPARKSAS